MPPSPRDLRRLLPALLTGGLALAIYGLTLPPGLTWLNQGADGGDLLAAALTAGVPHPPGYPTYQLLLRLALAVLPGNPARIAAWFSASCAALAVALSVDLARRVAAHRQAARPFAPAVAASLAGLTWSVSPLLWGQSTIVEVYALNALACVALLWLAWRRAEAAEQGHPTRTWALWTGLVLGLGLGNHLTLALMLPGLVLFAWLHGRDRAGAGGRRDLGWAAVGLAAGLAVYAYLPLAAAGRPPINWGDPVTPARFLWVVTARLYAPLAFGLPWAQLGQRLLAWATVIAFQLTPWGLVLAVAGLVRLDRRSRAWWAATLAIFLAYSLYAVGYNSTDSQVYLIPALAMLALWLAEALTWVFERVAGRGLLALLMAVAGLVLLPGASAIPQWPNRNLADRADAEQFAQLALAEAEPSAVILTAGDERTFALWYAAYGLRMRPDVAIFNVHLYGFDWYRRSFAETHPDLLPSAQTVTPLRDLVAQWLPERPVYVAEELDDALTLASPSGAHVIRRVVGIP